MSSSKGTLYIISAPSGAGKTSLVQAAVSQLDHLKKSVSHTTRSARPGEVDGINYHFVSVDQFKDLQQQNTFLESAEVFGHFYGTSQEWVQQQLQHHIDVVLEIDWQGAQQVRHMSKDSVSIFILPPSLEILRLRLQERAQDSKLVIEKRMRQAQAEISHYAEFDYLIVNDDFSMAVGDLISIVKAQRLRSTFQTERQQKLLEKLLSV